VVIGSWFEKAMRVDKTEVFVTGLEKLHPTWKVAGEWPGDDDPKSVLVGRRLAERLNLHQGQTITLTADSKGDGETSRETPAEFTISGVLETGGPEDNQVLAPLASVQRWTGLEGKIRRIEISALTKPEDAFAHSDVSRLSGADFDRWYCTPYVSAIAYQIQQAIPEAQAKPVYHVAETEGRIVTRVGVLMALLVVAALVAAGLAVASMMLATVLERRAEIGLFKALGASDARVTAVFLLEACAIGILGGLAGYALGSLLAWRLALVVFGSAVSVHWVILPISLAAAVLVTLAGSALPLGQALKISPSLALRD
jgi:putative ABC transport system permease protein